MRHMLFIAGLAAASFCAPRTAHAQKEDVMSNPDGFIRHLTLVGGPTGGLQITCAKTGKDAQLESVSYFFNKRAELDELLGIRNVAFDGITVTPALKKMEYYPLVEWLPFPDGVNVLLPSPAHYTVWWDVEKNDTVRDAAMIFIREGEKFCRNPRGLPTQFRPNSDDMVPAHPNSGISAAALRVRRSMPFFQE